MPSQTDRIMIEVDGFTSKLTAKTAVTAVRLLKERTPVDTGWARSNLVLSVGAPTTDPVGSKDSVDNGTSEGSISLVQSTYQTKQGSVFINNRVFYINRLNSGSSDQAPAGFIERAINEAITLSQRSRG